MKRTITYFFLVTAFSLTQLSGQVKAYPIDSWHSKVGFSVQFGGLFDVEGSFTDFSGTILFDEGDPTKLSATVIVATNSIHTGVGMRDNHLRSEDFFDAEKYPRIVFSSKKVVVERNKYTMIGALTMHGVTKEVSVPFQILHGEQADPWKNARVSLKGSFKLNRTDFGIGEPGDIGEEVFGDLLISARVFNTQTIALFSRPFGEEMMNKFQNEDIDSARKHFLVLQGSGDADTKKPSSFTFLHQRFIEEMMTDLAIETCKLGIENFPDYAPLYTALGNSYLHMGEHKAALEAYQKALELDKENTMAMEMLKLLKE